MVFRLSAQKYFRLDDLKFCYCRKDSIFNLNNITIPSREGESGLYLDFATHFHLSYDLAFNDPYALPKNEWRFYNQIGASQTFRGRPMLFTGTQYIMRSSPSHESQIEVARWLIDDPQNIKTGNGEIRSKFCSTYSASIRHIWYNNSWTENDKGVFGIDIEFDDPQTKKNEICDEVFGNAINYTTLKQTGLSLGLQSLDGIYKFSFTRNESYINKEGKQANRNINQTQLFPFHSRIISLGYEARISSAWFVKGANGKITGEGRKVSNAYFRVLYAPLLTGQCLNRSYQTINRFADASHFGFAVGGGWPDKLGFNAEFGSMPGMGCYCKITLFPSDIRLAKSARMMNNRVLSSEAIKALK